MSNLLESKEEEEELIMWVSGSLHAGGADTVSTPSIVEESSTVPSGAYQPPYDRRFPLFPHFIWQ